MSLEAVKPTKIIRWSELERELHQGDVIILAESAQIRNTGERAGEPLDITIPAGAALRIIHVGTHRGRLEFAVNGVVIKVGLHDFPQDGLCVEE